MQWVTQALLIVLGYLFGSIPFSFLVAKSRGVDLRKVGSGNTGASNVWRSCGFVPFVVALALDIFKGFVPTAIAYQVVGVDPVTSIVVGLVAMLGHVYPIFLGFRGGKAVATAGGVMLGLHPGLLIASAVIWTVIYKLSGYPSVASMLGIVILALASTALALMNRLEPAFAVFIWITLVVIFYLHRANIARLLRGTEHGIGPRAKGS